MDGTKLIVIGAITLLLGLMIPLLGYSLLTQPTNTLLNTTETPYQKPMEKPKKEFEIKDMTSFETYDQLFGYINTLYREYEKLSTTIFEFPKIFALSTELRESYMVTVTATMPTMTGTQIEGYTGGETGETRYSETNVQVKGVDEPDIVKTNGKQIAVAWRNELYVIDPITYELLWRKSFNSTISSIYLLNEYLVVIAVNEIYEPVEFRIPREELRITIPQGTVNTTIYVYLLANDEYKLAYSIDLTGKPMNSRVLNKILYLVTIQPFEPSNPVIPLINGKPVPAHEIYVIEDKPTTYTNIISLDITSGEYSAYSFIAGPYSHIYMSYEYLIIASHTPWYLREIDTKIFAIIMKFLPDNISQEINKYLEANKYEEAMNVLYDYLDTLTIEEIKSLFTLINTELSSQEYIRTDNTTFYVFKVNGLNLDYKGKLITEGNIRDQFCMEVYKEKYFVVATTVEHYKMRLSYWLVSPRTTTIAGNKEITVIENGEVKKYKITITEAKNIEYIYTWDHTVYIYPSISFVSVDNQLTIFDLEEMNRISNITNIAPGERIYAARIINDYFFIVTYRNVDPIFAINITDPYHPEIIGYLKIPGYNEYLHPLSNNRLLGIGVEGNNLVISLYDISDPRNIKELSKINIDDSTSLVLYNYHAFTIDYEKQLVFIPIRSYRIFLGYQTSNWDLGSIGILVCRYSEDKIETTTILQHPGASRTIYIGDKIYTISPTSIKVYNENTFEEITEIPLQ
ncbi:MAG: beta-propeller domain-containing protein [Staphylothermus sp.]|nr:beta-propeller domain-containing protein [Staphylothermus sp.]